MELIQARRRLVAPYLLQAEFMSAVRRLEKRGIMSLTETGNALALFRTLPMTFAWSDSWVERGLAISRAVGTSTVYDAVYLACAEDEAAELFTCDATVCEAFGSTLPERIRLFRLV